MSNVRYIKCDNCKTLEELDFVGISSEGWYSLYSDEVDVDLCSYKCLQDYVGGMQ